MKTGYLWAISYTSGLISFNLTSAKETFQWILMEAGAALGFAQAAGFSSKTPEQYREKCRLVVQGQTVAPENE